MIKLPQEHIVASLNLSKKLIDNDNFKNYRFIDLRVKNHLVTKVMSDKKFQTIIDCGFSKIRAGAFNEENKNTPFFIESNFIYRSI